MEMKIKGTGHDLSLQRTINHHGEDILCYLLKRSHGQSSVVQSSTAYMLFKNFNFELEF
jgi:hypothetical protein